MATQLRTPPRIATRRQRGFTLIEIMAVVLIMGMLMTLVGVAVMSQVDRARVTTAQAKMSQLENALEFYRMDNSRYPSTEQGLAALLTPPASGPSPRNYPPGGYLRKRDSILDPWGGEFQYGSPGEHNPAGFDLWSLGADQSPGGEDTDADIPNWDLGQVLGG